jgi:gamma-glutamyltranspeptidase / glutathione hydrolase
LPYASQRAPVLARNVVAAAQPLAAQAGLRMLQQGGTAADAVIAAAAALTVVEPVSSGLGSDAFALVWHRGECHALNASGRTPMRELAACRAGKIAQFGWPSVTVPGAVDGWRALSERFGALPFAAVLEPAIAYARDGFLVTPVVARVWKGLRAQYAKFPEAARVFFPGGRGPEPGSRVRLPDLARSLRSLADSRGRSLYEGELAQQIVAHARAGGGHIDAQDLRAHRSEWTRPLRVRYRDADVFEMAPNSQGIAALVALGVLAHFDLAREPADAPRSVHLQIEAAKLGLADAYAHVGDPQSMRVDVEQLLAPQRLQQLAQRISLTQARWPDAPSAPRSGGTTYVTAADSAGMVVSYIQSSGPGFGSGIVVPGTGIALQSRASAFHPDPHHANAYAPGKRPFHTNCPALVARAGVPLLSFGLMGWSMQPQAHVQFLVRAIDHGENPQAILDAPRWRIAFEEPAILLEPALQACAGAQLANLGHHIVKTEHFLPAGTPFGSHLMFGGASMIACIDGGYVAAADPRRDGCAVGC